MSELSLTTWEDARPKKSPIRFTFAAAHTACSDLRLSGGAFSQCSVAARAFLQHGGSVQRLLAPMK
jgi:hypothetical protein